VTVLESDDIFRAKGHKYPLAGEPGSVEFHSAYTRLLAELEAKTLGRRETRIY